MDGWIAIGELARELNTNCAKTGQLVKVLKFEVKKKNTNTSTHKYISLADAEILKKEFAEFKGNLGRKKKQGYKARDKRKRKEKKESDRPNSDELFVNPIIIQDFRTGEISGQGLEAYWGKMEGSK